MGLKKNYICRSLLADASTAPFGFFFKKNLFQGPTESIRFADHERGFVSLYCPELKMLVNCKNLTTSAITAPFGAGELLEWRAPFS